mmetsp:Transcript_16907/g.42246  ORF Transcript_16907/g.42246 Transcript_16907/m.42246 type:complete len:110 (+) Transcript_16907:1-330(+)
MESFRGFLLLPTPSSSTKVRPGTQAAKTITGQHSRRRHQHLRILARNATFKAERKSKFFPATQIPTRHGRLDRSLFSMRTDSSLPPPPPLSNTDCIVTRALKEILQNRE